MDTATPGALQVANGTYYDPTNFRHGDVNVEMIAHQLSLKCRWNGNTNDLTAARRPIFYSVAQHACIVHDIARDHRDTFLPGARWDLEEYGPHIYGLHHDDSEGPLLDIPRPLKRDPECARLVEVENRIQSVILNTLAIDPSPMVKECVRRIDNAMIFWERDALVGKPVTPYSNEQDHPTGTLYDWVPDFEPWSPSRAKFEYLQRYSAWSGVDVF